MGSEGLTLVELTIILAIIGVLSTVGMASYSSYIEKARGRDTITQIHEIELSILAYKTVMGRFPPDLAAVGWDTLRDKWGNPYCYLPAEDANPGQVRRDRFNNPLNTDFDLYSKGPDGRTQMELNAKLARDDIVRANNGEFIGIASDY
jgi:general secretion pathway protein G